MALHEPKKIPWPNEPDAYELQEIIGYGATATVQSALCKTRNERCAVKRINLDKCNVTMDELLKEITVMSQCHHENVVSYYTSFVVKDELWLVIELLRGGSLLDEIKRIMRTQDCKNGVLEETLIATIMKEVLKGIEYFHNNNQIHRDIKAGNILLGEDGSVQIADFGVSSWINTGGNLDRRNIRHTFVGTPCWMAPEVMEQVSGYNAKADIWSFGITAIELATGTAPYYKYPPMKVLMLTLSNDPPTLDTAAEDKDQYKNYTKVFRKMISDCLQKDPEKRPSATELLKHPFFKKAKDKKYTYQNLICQRQSSKIVPHVLKKSTPSLSVGRLHRTETGEWEWSEGDENNPTNGGSDNKNVALNESQKTKKDNSGLVSFNFPKQEIDKSTGNTPKKMVEIREPGHEIGVEALDINQATISSAGSGDHRNFVSTHLTPNSNSNINNNNFHLSTSHLSSHTSSFGTTNTNITKIGGSSQPFDQSHLNPNSNINSTANQNKMPTHDSNEENPVSHQVPNGAQISQSTQQTQENNTDANNIILYLALRIRNSKKELNDIKFDFTPGTDTDEGVAQELLGAGLIEAVDLQSVTQNLHEIIKPPYKDGATLIFPLASFRKDSTDNTTTPTPDAKTLTGFAQLTLLTTSLNANASSIVADMQQTNDINSNPINTEGTSSNFTKNTASETLINGSQRAPITNNLINTGSTLINNNNINNFTENSNDEAFLSGGEEGT